MPTITQQKIIDRALKVVEKNYRKGVVLLRETIEDRPSLVWRGDSILLGADVPRWAYRIWVGEQRRDRTHEIGFCNLRPLDQISGGPSFGIEDIPPIAEAYLRPPSHMLDARGKYAIYTQSNLQKLYGEDCQFMVTCFSQPHRLLGGCCAHAAIFMVLVMVCQPLNLRVPAIHETSYAVAKRTRKPKKNAIQEDGTFRIRGLRLDEIAAHLKSPLVGGAGVIEVHTKVQKNSDSLRVVAHQINEYLRHGLPVILSVDYLRLYEGDAKALAGLDLSVKEHPHVVVLVGARYPKGLEKARYAPESFVYHDSRVSPYMEKSCQDLIMAGAQFGKYQGNISFFVPVPKGVKRKMDAIAEFIRICHSKEADGQYLARLIGWSHALPTAEDLRYRLVPRDAVVEEYFADRDESHPVRIALVKHQSLLPQWIWVAEWYPDIDHVARRRASSLWFFDATLAYKRRFPTQAEGAFAFLQNEAFKCHIPGFPQETFKIEGYVKVARRGGLCGRH